MIGVETAPAPAIGAEEPQHCLVIVASVPAARGETGIYLDDKACSGLDRYARYWPGPVRCVFREGDRAAIVFGRERDPSTLPFSVELVVGDAIPQSLLADASVVLAAGDNYLDFELADRCTALGVPLVYMIENVLSTRLQIVALEDKSRFRRAKSMVWTALAERRRRRAFRRAAGLQANGTPAGDVYGALTPHLLTYFDTRMTADMMATAKEQEERRRRLLSGAPLRLAFSGRFERLKGVQDLMPIAAQLRDRGVDFRFDLFGSGSLDAPVKAALTAAGLEDRVTVHGSVDFDRELVPWLRHNADLFILCHRQSDPSCTYLETLGCGVPIVGYANRAFAGILKDNDIGWAVPLGDWRAVAATIARLDGARGEIADKAESAAAFGKANSFETTFAARVRQLRDIASLA
jgi:hypothetical protein